MSTHVYEAVAIGASAGGVDALLQLLPQLPADYALPVFIVIHLPPAKDSVLVELLQDKCAVRICEAADKETIQPGTVYLAPPDYHLLVGKNAQLSLSSEEPVLYSRPSIDVLFETAADAYGERLMGVILTGANEDGAEGLRVIAEGGGTALVQCPEHAFADTMPLSALKACPSARALEISEIADFLKEAA